MSRTLPSGAGGAWKGLLAAGLGTLLVSAGLVSSGLGATGSTRSA